MNDALLLVLKWKFLSKYFTEFTQTLFKSYLWLGKTPMGEWVKELRIVTGFIRSKYKATKISLSGNKEAGLAALYLAAMEKNIESVTLKDAPVSYLFDK